MDFLLNKERFLIESYATFVWMLRIDLKIK